MIQSYVASVQFIVLVNLIVEVIAALTSNFTCRGIF